MDKDVVDLDCSWLRTFLAIVKTESFTEAGRELHLSQSAVSRRVKELEEALGASLFERLNGHVHLTPSGRELVRQAEKVLLHADDAQRVIREIQSGSAGELRIGTTVTAANYLFPGLLAKYRRRFPHVRLVLRPDASDKLLAMVRRNELDVAAVGSRPPARDLQVRGHIKDKLVLIVPPRHPLAGRKGILPAALAGEDFILRDPSSDSRRLFEEWAQSAGIPLRILMDVWCPDTIKRLVGAGLGVTVLPWSSVKEELAARKVALASVKGWPLPIRLNVVAHKDRRQFQALDAFLELASRELGKWGAWEDAA